jgi:hypothetical protein
MTGPFYIVDALATAAIDAGCAEALEAVGLSE